MTNSKFYPPFLPAVIPDCHTTKINHLKHDRSISQLPDCWKFWVRNDTVCGLLTVIGNLNIVGFLKCIFSKSMTFHEFWSKEIALVKSIFFSHLFQFLATLLLSTENVNNCLLKRDSPAYTQRRFCARGEKSMKINFLVL